MSERDPHIEVDLSACEREPIHIPGAIQPHGILFGLDEAGHVRSASANAEAEFGPVFGKAIADILDCGDLRLELPSDARMAQHAGTVDHGGKRYDAFVHRSGPELVLELESIAAPPPGASEALAELLAFSSAIAEAEDLVGASQAAADAVRAITGYDRVMIYRFLEDDTGQVLAEARGEQIESFLNHRYPASDIPKQARALYVENRIRVIPDVGYAPAALDADHRDLDLSGALLRSVSPVHVQYLKNMGVGASASISLVHQGELWGLIACHHLSARRIGHGQRQISRLVALALESAVARLEEEASHREALRLTRRREELLPLVASGESLGDGLAQNAEELRRTVPADGVAIILGQRVVLNGATPTEDVVRELAGWLMRPSAPPIFASDRLATHYPAAEAWTGSGSGLLSLILSRSPALAVLWFRAEEVETVNWAGNPHKPLEPGALPGKLTPRHSFDVWVEQVRGRSRPWRSNEREAARELMDRLHAIAEHKSLAQLNRQLGEEMQEKEDALAEKDLLVREVHHRVQNNLQLVTSMLKLQERELVDEEARRQLELARDRIQSIATLHRRLWRSDDLQVVNLETFFLELTEELTATWGEEWRGHIRLEVAPLRLPGQAALLLGLAVTELLTNAFKHAYSGKPGPIILSAQEKGQAAIVIRVADKGVGTATGAEGRPGSFGSRLIQRLVQQIGGELDVGPNNPGTCVSLVVPRG